MKKEKKLQQKKRQRLSGKKPPKWFYLILILIPIMFFVLLEAVLRLISYGRDYTVFTQVTNYYPDKLYLNPVIPHKYFYNLQKGPGTIPDGFDIEKKKNAFRVFVLGGSSTAGWPYVPNVSFSRQLKRKLELLYPENKIEVVNCAMSAINSYTIRDFIPAVLNHKPDLILIYAGHNEYYGALGPGSSTSFGTSRFLTNSYIWLQDFKTTQLIQNIISGIYGAAQSTDDKTADNETLMSRMIGESLIPLNSDLYEKGIEQFAGNYRDIVKMINDADVPLIIGTVTSNLKDQKPFISVEGNNLPPADKIFNQAKEEYAKVNYIKSEELFLYAKELDALRFRAPKKINEIIKNYSEEFDIPLVDIDEAFKRKSENGIVGYNLTVDHLHPNIEGYKIIAGEFYTKMEEKKYLPEGKRVPLSSEAQDSILAADFPITALDSTLANMRLIMLLGAYPFVPKGSSNILMKNYKIDDIYDSISVSMLNYDITWEEGHVKLANKFLADMDYKNFAREMNAVIEERPYNNTPYEYLIDHLVEAGERALALSYLYKMDRHVSSYYSKKWIGQVELHFNNVRKALQYLEEAAKYKETDSQTLYNLAGAYYLNNQIDKAISAAEKSVALNPQNHLAKNLLMQLKQAGGSAGRN